jgi:hypothetical protein
LAVSDAAAERPALDLAPGSPASLDTPVPDEAPKSGRGFTGVGVTAAAAVVAGALLLTRDQSVSTLGTLAIIVGAVALFVTLAAVREWPWARQWTGPDGILERIAGPMAWLAVVFAAVIILTNFVPVIVPAWSEEQVFAVSIVAFIVLSVLGWGPGVRVAWPAGLRMSSLTVAATLVALLLIAVFLILLFVMREDALLANDAQWARLVEIRSTLEAVAFAAAGALLGILVQRQALAGELRQRQATLDEREAELAEARSLLAGRELQAESLLASATAAVRLLTPDAPDDLGRQDPVALASLPTRPSTAAVRQARRTLLEALRTAPEY